MCLIRSEEKNMDGWLPNGTPFAAQEDNRGTSYQPDPVLLQ
jgi:hypothetical protein